jgi:hypothetical protein
MRAVSGSTRPRMEALHVKEMSKQKEMSENDVHLLNTRLLRFKKLLNTRLLQFKKYKLHLLEAKEAGEWQIVSRDDR